ncbi:glycosyltransferase family 4 protein [Flavobacterium channae]|uniref:glycosyltransferase family 4 protein n=1 Tax=Flavobacterium channae TaxID=2897181 RepID=UPI001E4E35D9|nr:glycosyltransferase [Flavobacterium channae]UGS24220.1 glycosyltransferase [Flavobacterium channae]
MKLLVISSAPVVELDGKLHLYAPYEKEMQLWAKHADTIQFCCPIWREDKKLLIAPVSFEVEKVVELQEFDITSFSNKLKAIPLALVALVKIFKAMKQADHIHLRCPGNIALLACLVQILFSNKQKTAKYAGNWDPKSQQPWSYRLQKWILSTTFLTRNMQVLVYGEWPNQTKNIKPFFTATYGVDEIQNSEFRIQNKWSLPAQSKTTENNFDSAQSDKKDNNSLSLRAESRTNENQFKFLFIGTLSPGKQPLYAIQLVEELYKKGLRVTLELYGEGVLRKELELYIAQNKLEPIVTLKGNQSKETVLKAYQSHHFLILPSKSEGWPKVVAEAMFWGCVPIASPVSCVPYMMGNGSRGIILKEQLDFDVNQIVNVLKNLEVYLKMSSEGQSWSRQFTTDKFEAEIRKLLK